MEAWKVCLNVEKTQLLLSTAARRDWPEVFAGSEVLRSAKLLGVEVGPHLSQCVGKSSMLGSRSV
eukprot:1794105-Amphidinium_carterae.1